MVKSTYRALILNVMDMKRIITRQSTFREREMSCSQDGKIFKTLYFISVDHSI
jgi:hypothetical protein